MRTCQQCHEHEAIVHLTLASNGNSVTVHLCSECAAERGIKSGLVDWSSVAGLPEGIGDLLPEWFTGGSDLAVRCDCCGTTVADWRASRLLGCERCWLAFESSLTDLVRRFHGSRVHQGPVYLRPDQEHHPDVLLESHRARIRAELADAVGREAFEDAAVLRDALRELGEPG